MFTTTAPFGSVTRPVMLEKVVWAQVCHKAPGQYRLQQGLVSSGTPANLLGRKLDNRVGTASFWKVESALNRTPGNRHENDLVLFLNAGKSSGSITAEGERKRTAGESNSCHLLSGRHI